MAVSFNNSVYNNSSIARDKLVQLLVVIIANACVLAPDISIVGCSHTALAAKVSVILFPVNVVFPFVFTYNYFGNTIVFV